MYIIPSPIHQAATVYPVIGMLSTHLVLHLLDGVERHGDQGDQNQDGGGDAHELGRDGGEGLLHQVPHPPAGLAQGHAVEQSLVLLHLHLGQSTRSITKELQCAMPNTHR